MRERIKYKTMKTEAIESLTMLKYDLLTPEELQRLDKILLNKHNCVLEIGDYILSEHSNPAQIIDIDLSGEDVMVMLDEKSRWEKFSYYLGYRYKIHHGSLDELKADAFDYINTPQSDSTQTPVTGTEMILVGDIDYQQKKRELVIKRQSQEALMSYVTHIMEQKRWELQDYVKKMNKEIERVTKIIWTIELYLGLKEELVLLKDGLVVSDLEPIHMMQELLYMDEEVGDPTNDGVDVRNVDLFYDWMLNYSNYFKCNNYELLLPYPKCMRIMRIRRNKKAYEDSWTSAAMNRENMRTFLFIRNGEKIYKIETNIRFGEKLFPSNTELMDIFDKKDDWGRDLSKEAKEKEFTDEMDRYKRNLVIMQGLIDRTMVFGNLAGRVNFLTNDSLEKGDIVYHYDAERGNILTDGGISFTEKIKQGRKNIVEGTQVLFKRFSEAKEYKDGRFIKYYRNFPEYPTSGRYETSIINEDTYLYYYPSCVWSTGEPSKVRVAFKFYDDEVFNMDEFTYKDFVYLEKMLHDRRERKHYLDYIWYLQEIYRIKKEEYKEEEPFVEMMQGIFPAADTEAVYEKIEWWKTKTKFKRQLTTDDAKAFRMISKKLKKFE